MAGTVVTFRPPPAGQPVVAMYGCPMAAAYNEVPGAQLSHLLRHHVMPRGSVERGTWPMHTVILGKALPPTAQEPVELPATISELWLTPAVMCATGLFAVGLGSCYGQREHTAYACRESLIFGKLTFAAGTVLMAGGIWRSTGHQFSTVERFLAWGIEAAAIVCSILASHFSDREQYRQSLLD